MRLRDRADSLLLHKQWLAMTGLLLCLFHGIACFATPQIATSEWQSAGSQFITVARFIWNGEWWIKDVLIDTGPNYQNLPSLFFEQREFAIGEFDVGQAVNRVTGIHGDNAMPKPLVLWNELLGPFRYIFGQARL